VVGAAKAADREDEIDPAMVQQEGFESESENLNSVSVNRRPSAAA
jgi:hypothetical protein